MKGFSSQYSTKKPGHVFGCSFVIGSPDKGILKIHHSHTIAIAPYCKVSFYGKAGGTFYFYYINTIIKVAVTKSHVLILDQLFTCLDPSGILKKDIF